MSSEKQPLTIPVLIGPTAAGKTALAMDIADALDCDIISCDSRQIYRGMDIGTAKPSREQRRMRTHHLIDIINPDQQWSAFDFAREAGRIIRELHELGRRVLLCGGTGFYLQALSRGIGPHVPCDELFRAAMRRRVAQEGPAGIFYELAALDPAAARRLHPNDTQRVIRALEINRMAGRAAKHRPEYVQPENVFDYCVVIASRPRTQLYHRIDDRVDAMMREGLWEEFLTLRKAGYTAESPGMLCLGYRELFAVENGVQTLDAAVEAVKVNTRRYAKRQLTWFRNRCMGQWVMMDQDGARERTLTVFNACIS